MNIQDRAASSTATEQHSYKGHHWGPWVFLAVLTIGCAIAFTKCIEFGEKIVNAFKPTVNYQTVINSTVTRMKSQANLVVLATEVTAEIEKRSEANWTAFGFSIPRGTTTVRLRAQGNKVQYIVPLSNVTSNHFRFDSVAKKLIVTVPEPLLDENLVEIQSDPAQIQITTEVGWARLDSYSGQFLRDEAKRALRPTVIQEGRRDFIFQQAEQNAKLVLKSFLEPLTSKFRDVELAIEFSPPS